MAEDPNGGRAGAVVDNRVLVKLRPAAALGAAEARAGLRPLFDRPLAGPEGGFGLDAAPRWFVAELPDGAATAWDLAHARVADQLGVAESEVLYAEPDLVHKIYRDEMAETKARPGTPFAVGEDCTVVPQDGSNGKPPP